MQPLRTGLSRRRDTGLAERVEVDPHLCQGGGICATVCPGGAMQYSYPSVEDAIARVRRLIQTYRSAGGADPVLLIHEADVPQAPGDLPDNVLPSMIGKCRRWLAVMTAMQ